MVVVKQPVEKAGGEGNVWVKYIPHKKKKQFTRMWFWTKVHQLALLMKCSKAKPHGKMDFALLFMVINHHKKS